MSSWRQLEALNTVTFPLKASRYKQHREHCSLLWPKGRCTNAIHSEMHPVYGSKILTSVWANKASWAAMHIRYRATISCLSLSAAWTAWADRKLVDRWDKCLNRFIQYLQKWRTCKLKVTNSTTSKRNVFKRCSVCYGMLLTAMSPRRLHVTSS